MLLKGLMEGKYDACTGWMPTIARIQVFDFSLSFFEEYPIYVYQKTGVGHRLSDLAKLKIGEKILLQIQHIILF